MDYMRINSNDQLDLEGLCLSGCDGLSLTYDFNLFMLDLANRKWIPFNASLSYLIRLNQSSKDVTISKDLFEDYPNQNYWKVKMTTHLLTFTFKENTSSESSIYFHVNHSPWNGTCDINPRNGSTQDVFKISCDFWLDIDGNILTYAYYG